MLDIPQMPTPLTAAPIALTNINAPTSFGPSFMSIPVSICEAKSKLNRDLEKFTNAIRIVFNPRKHCVDAHQVLFSILLSVIQNNNAWTKQYLCIDLTSLEPVRSISNKKQPEQQGAFDMRIRLVCAIFFKRIHRIFTGEL